MPMYLISISERDEVFYLAPLQNCTQNLPDGILREHGLYWDLYWVLGGSPFAKQQLLTVRNLIQIHIVMLKRKVEPFVSKGTSTNKLHI